MNATHGKTLNRLQMSDVLGRVFDGKRKWPGPKGTAVRLVHGADGLTVHQTYSGAGAPLWPCFYLVASLPGIGFRSAVWVKQHVTAEIAITEERQGVLLDYAIASATRKMTRKLKHLPWASHVIGSRRTGKKVGAN